MWLMCSRATSPSEVICLALCAAGGLLQPRSPRILSVLCFPEQFLVVCHVTGEYTQNNLCYPLSIVTLQDQ